MSNMFSDDKKYIFDKFYESYNREINILWQRSIFLTAFITGITVVYGKVFEKAVETDYLTYKGFLSYSIILLFIATVGIVLSLLWIFMSKGSKYYQEIYEGKISVMSKKLGIDALQCTENIDEKSFFDETGVEPKIVGRVNYEKIDEFMSSDNYHQNKIKNCFFSIKAGEYSVGKINILIGYVFLVAWFIIANLHLFSFICFIIVTSKTCKFKHLFKFKNIYCIPNKFVEINYCFLKDNLLQYIVLLLILFVLILLLYRFLDKFVHSGGF